MARLLFFVSPEGEKQRIGGECECSSCCEKLFISRPANALIKILIKCPGQRRGDAGLYIKKIKSRRGFRLGLGMVNHAS